MGDLLKAIKRKIAEEETKEKFEVKPEVSIESLIPIGNTAEKQDIKEICSKEEPISNISINLGDNFKLILGIDKENSYIRLYQNEEFRGEWIRNKEKVAWKTYAVLSEIKETISGLSKAIWTEREIMKQIRTLLSLNSGKLEEIIARNRNYRNLYGVYAHNTHTQNKDFSHSISDFEEQGLLHERIYGVSKTTKKATDATINTDKNNVDLLNKKYFSFAFPRLNGLIIVYHDKTHEIIEKAEFPRYGITSMPIIHNDLRWKSENMENWLGELNPKIDAKSLFNAIVAQYETYIDFSQPEMAKIHTLWDMGTYLFPLFNAYPYMNIWGIKGCGKTKVMQLSMLMSLNGFSIVSTSPSALFRIVDYLKPTLYIDEAEKFYGNKKNTSEDTDSIKSMLNAGFMSGAKVIRSDKNEPSILESFDVYCPKMFASINGLDGALNDRCISEVMVRTNKDDRGDLWAVEGKEFKQIRNNLYSWALENWSLIEMLYNTCHKDFKISNRDWLIWKPLLSIAFSISVDLYNELGHFAEKYITEKRDEDEDGWERKISFALLEITRSKTEKNCYIRDIRDYLSSQGELGEELPSSSFIGRFINKVGLKQYKVRGKNNYYKLTRENVIDIIGRHYEIPQEYLPATEEVISVPNKIIEKTISVIDEKQIKTDDELIK